MDSGAGGLSVFREIRKLLPGARYIYFADNANCPYGDKPAAFIIERCRTITEMMIRKGADVLVLACNTATAAAIATLRQEFSIPFIGMEPAVKTAAGRTESGIIGVLATTGTLKASKYIDTKGRFANGVKIFESVGKGFVELVESCRLDGPEAEQTCARSLLPLLEKGADTIVLGCTHYPFLLDTLKKVAAENGHPQTRFIDPAPAVARQLRKVIEENGIAEESPEAGLELYASGSDRSLRELLPLTGTRGTFPSEP